MSNTNDFSFLISALGNGWLLAIISLILNFAQLIKRQRPAVLECEITDITNLTKINNNIRNKIQIIYNDKKVTNLTLINIIFLNSGTTAIVKPTITISFPNKVNIFGITGNIKKGSFDKFKISGNVLSVTFPYINSYKDHKIKTSIDILCDKTINEQELSISGGGENWSLVMKKESPFLNFWRGDPDFFAIFLGGFYINVFFWGLIIVDEKFPNISKSLESIPNYNYILILCLVLPLIIIILAWRFYLRPFNSFKNQLSNN